MNLKFDSGVEELFASGNLTHAAFAPSDSIESCAAKGLIGIPAPAIAFLGQRDEPKAQLYLACTYWVDGDEDRAARILERLDMPEARRLLALIRQDKISVLSQLPWSRAGVQTLLLGIAHDPKFDVKNYSFHPEDHRNEPNADIHKWYDAGKPPDFYVVNMLEWHQVPLNIHEAPFPTFAHTSDTDIHIQAVRRHLTAFDCILTLDHTEYAHVKMTAPRQRIVTAPLSFGWDPAQNVPAAAHRDIDLFMSGTLLHAYHGDKAELVSKIMRLTDRFNIVMVDGYIPDRQYYELVSRSKTTLCYYRKSGGMVTRAIDALCMGSIPLVQEDSVVQLYDPTGRSMRPYKNDFSDLVSVFESAVATERASAAGSADLFRRVFDYKKSASQYFRQIAALTALDGDKYGRRPLDSRRDQRRSVAYVAWLPAPHICARLLESNGKLWLDAAGPPPTASEALSDDRIHYMNLLSREYLQQYVHDVFQCNDAPNEDTNKLAIMGMSILGDLVETRRHKRLVLYFNYIRFALFFGTGAQKEQARKIIDYIVAQPADAWEISADDDVYPYDFLSEFFNYRKYLNAVVTVPIDRSRDSGDAIGVLRRTILASVHYHAAIATGDLASFRKACELDGEFPYYKRDYAAALLKSGRESDVREAVQLLSVLTKTSALASQSIAMLHEAYTETPSIDSRMVLRAALDACGDTASHWRDSFTYMQNHNRRKHGLYFKRMREFTDKTNRGYEAKVTRKPAALLLCDFDARPLNFDMLRNWSDRYGEQADIHLCRPFTFRHDASNDAGIQVRGGARHDYISNIGAILTDAVHSGEWDTVVVINDIASSGAIARERLDDYFVRLGKRTAEGQGPPAEIFLSYTDIKGELALIACALPKHVLKNLEYFDVNMLLTGLFDPFDIPRKGEAAGRTFDTNLSLPIPDKADTMSEQRRLLIEALQPNLLVRRPSSVGDNTQDFLVQDAASPLAPAPRVTAPLSFGQKLRRALALN